MTVARFALSYGLRGCYMPDSFYTTGTAVTRRRDLIETVRDAIDFYDLPRSALATVRWREVWRHAKRHGTSSLHFSIGNGPSVINFHGMTEAELEEAEANEDY